jgi:hypothetical protein
MKLNLTNKKIWRMIKLKKKTILISWFSIKIMTIKRKWPDLIYKKLKEDEIKILF